MQPSDPSHPDYYHRIVDCQWACPAHTNVPGYIRLIAEKKFTEAYLLNRRSNVFPGILGRVCDRPCEPACRRGRLGQKPVAICRLKRVAADNRDPIDEHLPPAPAPNGKKVALIGSGPASLTVANDLIPLGYTIDLMERDGKLGGAMRSQVPGFRLPESVLDEEIGMIVDRGVNVRTNCEVKSLKSLLDPYDAIFVGTGAPIGRDLPLPGREEAGSQVRVGIQWLASVAFGHEESLPSRVLVIGGGNTAMDCCRTALRLGSQEVKVIAPEAYDEMLASPWEKEDAEEEKIEFINHLLPKSFEVKDGKLQGVTFQPLTRAYDDDKRWDPVPSDKPTVTIPCDGVILAIGQNRAFPFIEDDCGVKKDEQGQPVVNETTFQSTQEKVFFGGDSAFGPKNIIWAVEHGHQAAISIHHYLQGRSVEERLPPTMNLTSQKMGLHEWSYENEFGPQGRQQMRHVPLKERLSTLKIEVELGFDDAVAAEETQRCLNCDVQTVFAAPACIECDACIDICPLDCLTLADNSEEPELRENLTAPALNLEQPLYVSEGLATGRVMVKDEDLCLHCGLCAERCPTGAWDMQRFTLNLPQAGEA